MSCCREMSCISSRTGTTEGFPTLITTRSNPPHWSKSRGPWTRNTRNSRSTTTSYRAILAATRRNSRSRGLARLVSHCPSRPRRRAVQVGIAARAGGVRHQSSLSAQGHWTLSDDGPVPSRAVAMGRRPKPFTKPAVPSTTKHSRFTFNCRRTLTIPSRPEVAETRNRKWEAVNRRRTETAVTPRRRALSEARQYAMGRTSSGPLRSAVAPMPVATRRR